MSRRVLFTPAAREQFLAALAYTAAADPAAARSLRDRAAASLSRLADYPGSGRALPEFPDLSFRAVIVPPYRFFYRVMDDAVWVVAAWHSASSLASRRTLGVTDKRRSWLAGSSTVHFVA